MSKVLNELIEKLEKQAKDHTDAGSSYKADPFYKCASDIRVALPAVEAEMREAFSKGCDEFHRNGSKCVTCGRLDLDTVKAVEAERKELVEALQAYDAAADKFIGKVERGEAYSKVTYSELKDARALSARVKEK